MSWLRYNRRNPCPVCQGERNDCRQNTTTGLVYCRSHEANPKDYLYRGQDTWGFNIWAYKPDADAWTDERRQEWLEEQRRQREQREQRESLKKLLPIPERDKVIREILDQLTLSDDHREVLRGRGISDRKIEESNYRSVKQWQKLTSPVTNKLSGVKYDGLSLINHTDGILIPIPNEDGLYTHLRVNDLTPGTENKYYPLSSSKRGVKYHLPSGEQPIGVYMPQEAPEKQIIGFTEGLEYKPLLASSNVGIPIIGASGGNFGSSSEAIEDAIASIKERYKWENPEFVLYGDAGSAANPSVSRQYEKLGDFIPNLKVADWGQLTNKEALDIDEIDVDENPINYLSMGAFLEKARWCKYKDKTLKAWILTKKFTPTLKVKQEFIDLPKPENNTMFLVKSGLGTGKTTLLVKWLKTEWSDYGGINLGYRNTLLMQFCEKSGFVHIHNCSSWVDISAPTAIVASCVDSHLRFNPDDFEGKVLIIDEVVSVLKHLLFSSTVGERGRAIALFIEGIKRARVVVGLDGNLSDMYCDFFEECDPLKKVIKVENTYKGKKPELILLEGTIKDENLRKRDNSPWLYDLLNSLDMLPVVASDSQILLEAIDEIYQDQGLVGLRIDSTTIDSKEVQEFLKEPAQWIRENEPQYVLFSPSCESGLDVAITDYFSHFFGLFFGVLDADSITQIIARVRDVDLTRYLWVMPYVKADNPDSIKTPLVDSFKYYYNQRLIRDLDLVMAGQISSEEIMREVLSYMTLAQASPEHQLSQRIQTMIYYEKSYLRECVYWLLEQQGYDTSNRVAPVLDEGFRETSKKVSKEKKKVKRRKSKDIFNSSDKYIGNPSILLKWNTSWAERCALIKAIIEDKLPGITKHIVWSEDFIYQIQFQFPNLFYQLEDRYYLDNLEKCLERSQRMYHRQLVKGRTRKKLTPWKLNSRYQRLWTLREVGIHELIHNHYDVELTTEHPVVKEIMAKCGQKKNWISLGKKPHQDTIKYLKWLLGQIGYTLRSQQKRNEQGEAVRVYKLMSIPHEDVARYVGPMMEIIARKYDQPQPVLNWDEGLILANEPEESILQEQVCSTQIGVENSGKLLLAENAENHHEKKVVAVTDVGVTLLEEPAHLLQLNRNTNPDDPLRKCPASEIPPEAVDECDRKWIAEQLESCQSVDDVRYWWYEVGLVSQQLQLGWDLLTSEVKQRLRLLFNQMKALET
ncbi:plasmid replication protein, CyRepA1 family [Crocosphaera sp. Alani8]|uniref:plasmid replication protein, CyRepA1 family n=1 Tax=Crocosphaera sp. Alani8 TaxID=3038952 RepID=UPI00313C0D3F